MMVLGEGEPDTPAPGHEGKDSNLHPKENNRGTVIVNYGPK